MEHPTVHTATQLDARQKKDQKTRYNDLVLHSEASDKSKSHLTLLAHIVKCNKVSNTMISIYNHRGGKIIFISSYP